MSGKRHAIGVSADDHRLISELAEQLNKSRADIVREAVAGFVLLKDLGEDLAPPAKRKEIRPCSE